MKCFELALNRTSLPDLDVWQVLVNERRTMRQAHLIDSLLLVVDPYQFHDLSPC